MRRSAVAGVCATVGLAALLLLQATASEAVTIGPGDTLDIPFVIPGTPVVAGGVDVLTFSFVQGDDTSGLTALTVELWDEGILRGQNPDGTSTIWGFTGPDSLWTLNAVPADLSSFIDAGTSDGRVRVIPAFSSSVPDPAFELLFPRILIGHGTQPAGLLPATPGATIVPEPGTALLLGLGLLALGRRQRG